MEMDCYKVSLSSRSWCIPRPLRWWTGDCLGKARLVWIDSMNSSALDENLVSLSKTLQTSYVNIPEQSFNSKHNSLFHFVLIITGIPIIIQYISTAVATKLTPLGSKLCDEAVCFLYIYSNSVPCCSTSILPKIRDQPTFQVLQRCSLQNLHQRVHSICIAKNEKMH